MIVFAIKDPRHERRGLGIAAEDRSDAAGFSDIRHRRSLRYDGVIDGDPVSARQYPLVSRVHRELQPAFFDVAGPCQQEGALKLRKSRGTRHAWLKFGIVEAQCVALAAVRLTDEDAVCVRCDAVYDQDGRAPIVDPRVDRDSEPARWCSLEAGVAVDHGQSAPCVPAPSVNRVRSASDNADRGRVLEPWHDMRAKNLHERSHFPTPVFGHFPTVARESAHV